MNDGENEVGFPYCNNYFFDLKGASSFHLELFGPVHMKVGGFEPNLISHFPRGVLRYDGTPIHFPGHVIPST